MAANIALRPLVLAAALISGGAHAQDDVRALIEKLSERIERLEKRNAELEREIASRRSPDIEQRVKALETNQAALDKGLESDTISQYEPELSSRLKAVEKDTLEMKKAAKTIDALDGVKAGASLTTVAQKPYGLPDRTTEGNSQLNYRADVTVRLPLEPIGSIEHGLFGHIRIGQGEGLNVPFAQLGAFAGAPNAVAFRASGAAPDDSVAILGEAWYQATIPLPYGGFKPHSRQSLELTFGKVDIFSFFDQNTVAGDEARQFLNSAFVHSPLLDAGGEVGVNANGFQPGFIVAYNNDVSKAVPWRLSLGAFGAGNRGANYQRTFSEPLLIAQAETAMRLFGGLAGNYRAYLWRRGRAAELNGTQRSHSGWGVSVNQQVADSARLFARYADLMRGSMPFDRALTVGGEIDGSWWGRGADVVGFAAGWLNSSRDFRATAQTIDVDADGTGDFTYLPAGAERLAELYYRFQMSKNFELSPDFQYIAKMGANPQARSAKVLGLRAQISF